MSNTKIRYNDYKNYYMLEIGVNSNDIDLNHLKFEIEKYKIFHFIIGEKLIDLNFLKDIKDVVRVLINLYSSSKNFEVISNLSNLEFLRLDDIKKSKLELKNLQNLKELIIKANGLITGLEFLNKLERLEIYSWKKEFGLLKLPKNLYRLELIRFNGENLDFSIQSNINELGLYYCYKTINISEIVNYKELKKIHFQSCKKIKDLTPLLYLKNLEEVYLEDQGTIESIQFLRNIKTLKSLKITGNSTILDPDIDFIKDLDDYFVCGEIGGKKYHERYN